MKHIQIKSFDGRFSLFRYLLIPNSWIVPATGFYRYNLFLPEGVSVFIQWEMCLAAEWNIDWTNPHTKVKKNYSVDL